MHVGQAHIPTPVVLVPLFSGQNIHRYLVLARAHVLFYPEQLF